MISVHRILRLLIVALPVLVALAPPLAEGRKRARRAIKRGDHVHGRVIQVTTQRVFVNFGARRFGVAVGDELTIAIEPGRVIKVKVDRVAPSFASAQLGDELPRLGAKVTARHRPPAAKPAPARVALPPPAVSAEELSAGWQGVERRRPELLDYRPTAARHEALPVERAQGQLHLDYLGQLNLGSEEPRHFHVLQLRSDLDLPRLLGGWLDYSHRLRLRLLLSRDLDARPFSRARPAILVQRLRVGLNVGRSFEADLGRMVGGPIAPAGLVDGGAARVRVTPWLHVGGFGGLSPRPDDLRPAADAGHFGGFASLRLAPRGGRGQQDWFVTADLAFAGSTWDGRLDRRALSGRATLDWSRLAVLAQATVDLYPGDHPSGEEGADLSQLALSADVRAARWLRLGARFDRYRFVPTLESLATFPADYLSITDAVSSGRGYADVELGSPEVVLSGQGGYDRQSAESWSGWGELMLRLHALAGEDTLRASGLLHRGSTAGGYGGRLAYSRPLAEWLSVNASYGVFRDSYEAAFDPAWRHDVGGGFDAVIGHHWLLAADARLLVSGEEELLALFATFGYHL